MNDLIQLRAPFSTETLTVGVLCLFAVCGPVSAETIQCTPITSVPATITTQGIYCLTGHLNTNITTGNAIEIQTNNVTIDLNGYKIGGLAAGDATAAIGIYALNRKNITLRNGIIRGFYRGVLLEDDSPGDSSYGGHLLEDLRFDGNTHNGLRAEGPGNLIRQNRVIDTGGTTVTGTAFGIVAYGPGARILNNEVDGTFAGTGFAHGIRAAAAGATIIQGNRVTETTSTGGGNIYGISRGGGSAGLTIEANIVSNASTTGTAGIYVNDAQSICGNNRVQGFTTGIDICADAGGNFSL